MALAAMLLMIAVALAAGRSSSVPTAAGGVADGATAAFYDPSSGRIVADGRRSTEELALELAHAATHAGHDGERDVADPDDGTRSEYVRRMLDEESAGIVGAIEVKRELEAAGGTIPVRVPLEHEYEAAYSGAVTALGESTPSATPAELEAAAKAAGLAAVRRALESGKVIAVATAESASAYYARTWEARRAARRPETGSRSTTGRIDP